MNSPEDEIPIPGLPVLSEEETIKQLCDDLTRPLRDEIKRLREAGEHDTNSFNEAAKFAAQLIDDLRRQRDEAIAAHDKVTDMISRYLVACKGHVADSWMDGFIECGAIAYDPSYPTGFIEPVRLKKL